MIEAFVLDACARSLGASATIPLKIPRALAGAEVGEYRALLQSPPIRVERAEWLENIALESLARKHNLSAYDVAYIDLARRKRLPMATSDAAVKRAAGRGD